MANINPIQRSGDIAARPPRDYRQLANNLKKQIDGFTVLVPPEDEQLSDFAKATKNLSNISGEALELTQKPTNQLMEDIQNSAQTAQTVISQPLDVEGAEKDISLEKASAKFEDEQAANADPKQTELYKIIRCFRQYPEQTESLKTELTLSSQDLSYHLRS